MLFFCFAVTFPNLASTHTPGPTPQVSLPALAVSLLLTAVYALPTPQADLTACPGPIPPTGLLTVILTLTNSWPLHIR
jgi:hypothetical protein